MAAHTLTPEIAPAGEDAYEIVCVLAQAYIDELSVGVPAEKRHTPLQLVANYWGRPGARRVWPSAWRGFPFLVRADGEVIGFALIKQIGAAPVTFDMDQFYIAPAHRRDGAGRQAATALFDRFAGVWEVRQIPGNKAGQAFWRRVIADYTQGEFSETTEVFAYYDNGEYLVQRFRSRASSGFVEKG